MLNSVDAAARFSAYMGVLCSVCFGSTILLFDENGICRLQRAIPVKLRIAFAE
jgi:hypothetical protein